MQEDAHLSASADASAANSGPADTTATPPPVDPMAEDPMNTLNRPTPVANPMVEKLSSKGIELGKHYRILEDPFFTEDGYTTVTEFFWYGCGHCMNAEPLVAKWKSELPEGGGIIKIPAIWNALMELHARFFFVIELAVPKESRDALHTDLFPVIIELREQKVGLIDQRAALKQRVVNAGVSEKDFETLFESEQVQKLIDAALAMQKRANISGTPAFIIEGEYYLNLRELDQELGLIELGNTIIRTIQQDSAS